MNINSTQKLDYSFFQNLYEEGKTGWKGLYFEEAQRCFESAFSKINRWGWFEKEERYGILSEDGKSVTPLSSQDEQATLSDANSLIAISESETKLSVGDSVTVVVLERRYI